MPQKRHTVDQVVAKLRKADVAGKGKTVTRKASRDVECVDFNRGVGNPH